MADVRQPYYVSFTHDRIRHRVDHSRSQPGPPDGSANRGGFTRVRSKARLEFVWEQGPIGADGQVPVFAMSVNVRFRLTDFLVAISSDFAVGSCAYRVTRRHEFDAHIRDPIRIFHSYRDILVRRLSVIAIPTEQTPVRVASDQVDARQEAWERPVVAVIRQTRGELAHALRQARDRHDSAASYRLVYRQCTDAEWATGQ